MKTKYKKLGEVFLSNDDPPTLCVFGVSMFVPLSGHSGNHFQFAHQVCSEALLNKDNGLEPLSENEVDFPDYEGEFVSVFIALLEGIVENSYEYAEIFFASFYQYELACNWQVYEKDPWKFIQLDNGIGKLLMQLQHDICPPDKNGLTMADQIVASHIMALV